MFNWFKSDEHLIGEYLTAGAQFGNAVSMLMWGECIGFEKLFSKLEKLEAEIIARGYRTISIDDFVEFGGYGKPVGEVQERDEGEDPIYHVQLFLGKVEPIISLDKLMSGQV